MNWLSFSQAKPATGPVLVLYTDMGADNLSEIIDAIEPGSPQDLAFHWGHAEIMYAEPAPFGGLKLYHDGAKGRELSAIEYADVADSGLWCQVTDLFRDAKLPNHVLVSGTEGYNGLVTATE